MGILSRIRNIGLATVLSSAAIVATPVAAQVDQALAEARSRVACGAATLVSATYIGGGMMRVTCSQPDRQQQNREQPNQSAQQSIPANSPLAGTGLSTPVAAGIVLSVITLAVITDNGTEGTTTTATSGSGTAVGLR
ncbi:MAG: hypothetical protein CML02_22775 [Pseudooceanicola sp.]|jgi:hypothetical protein|nr:hypothetical protein [Pseudooceanicola sp.]|tara:strand:+ start:2852 stop:3262 length:411 start_codon:yes stop_codon:yes gene_type:complete